jgi:hypothetical protein
MKKTISMMFLVMLSVALLSGIVLPTNADLLKPIPFPGACPFTVPRPTLTHQNPLSFKVTATYLFATNPPGVSDWGSVTLVSRSLLHQTFRADVVVYGPSLPGCDVLDATHTQTHTYTITPGPYLRGGFTTFTLQVWVNGVLASSIDFRCL